MHTERGVAVIAFGGPARRAAETCIESLGRASPGLAVHLIDRKAVPSDTNQRASRRAKTSLLSDLPYTALCYLDADTIPYQDISAGFEMLADGWDLVIAPSTHQGEDCLWHIEEPERSETFAGLGYIPLQLQAGVMFVRKSERTLALFNAWAEEWRLYGDQDQAALLRALHRYPVKIWLLGKPWNGGAVIGHKFGSVRQ